MWFPLVWRPRSPHHVLGTSPAHLLLAGPFPFTCSERAMTLPPQRLCLAVPAAWAVFSSPPSGLHLRATFPESPLWAILLKSPASHPEPPASFPWFVFLYRTHCPLT